MIIVGLPVASTAIAGPAFQGLTRLPTSVRSHEQKASLFYPMNDQATRPLYEPAEQEEFMAILASVNRRQPWHRRAMQDGCDMMDRGIIKDHPVHVMVRDSRTVSASHRARHDLQGGAL